MTDWTEAREVTGFTGDTFLERFTPEAAAPIQGLAHIRFRVIEEEWDDSVEPPVRVIKRIEVA